MTEFILVFAYLWVSVLVHEFGHYAAARHFGLPISELRIGTGPTMFKFYRRGALLSFNVFPTGGVVHLSFTAVERWKRIVLYVSGPLANFVLAVPALAVDPLLARINLAMMIFNLLPFKGHDGRQIVDDIRGRSKFRKAFEV